MKLSRYELDVLTWANPCAVVWATDAADPYYLAGKKLEQLGFVTPVAVSPSQWTITPTGQAALSDAE